MGETPETGVTATLIRHPDFSSRFLTPCSTAQGRVPPTTVYDLNANVSYQITRWVRARAVYRFSQQEGGRIEIRHNILSISLDLTYPIPVE